MGALRVSLAASARSPTARQRARPHWLDIRVDDDGPGLTAEQLAEPIARGRRLDETKPGSGLGHSIVADLAYCYSGKFELARSDPGGLSARLTLPLADLSGIYDNAARARTSSPNRGRTFARIGAIA